MGESPVMKSGALRLSDLGFSVLMKRYYVQCKGAMHAR